MLFERRRHPRVSPEGLSTPLGEVVDASESGLRVFCKRRSALSVGQELVLAVAYDGRIERVTGVVERVEPVGPRGAEVGVSLDETPATLRKWLCGLGGGDEHTTTGARVYVAA